MTWLCRCACVANYPMRVPGMYVMTLRTAPYYQYFTHFPQINIYHVNSTYLSHLSFVMVLLSPSLLSILSSSMSFGIWYMLHYQTFQPISTIIVSWQGPWTSNDVIQVKDGGKLIIDNRNDTVRTLHCCCASYLL
jgi:hypothetical protein